MILVDTNIIIESVRVKCWSAITGHFKIETVDKCCEEARTGDLHRPGYVQVSERDLKTRLAIHRVSRTELANLVLQDAESFRLDDGERHLWAHALTRRDEWFACCSDHAAIKAAVRLGWKDRLLALEELINHAGASGTLKQLKSQFLKIRLSQWVTDALLERGIK
jgi:hypothetical protein